MDGINDGRLRRIRNIELDRQELETLLPRQKQRLPGPALNAFAAILQDAADRAGHRNFTLFLSIIPAMAAGKMREGGYPGTIEEHVLATCKDGNKEDARTRTRWAIPLHGGRPEHWVLGWVDYAAGEYGLVDSIPEINSKDWAIPLFQTGIERVRSVLDMCAVDWRKFEFRLRSPPQLERQDDAWSCGLYVMIAMQWFVDGGLCPLLGRSAKEIVRASALAALLKLP